MGVQPSRRAQHPHQLKLQPARLPLCSLTDQFAKHRLRLSSHQVAQILADDLRGVGGFNHRQSCGIHGPNRAIGRQHFHTLRFGLNDRPQQRLTLRQILLQSFALGDIAEDDGVVRTPSMPIWEIAASMGNFFTVGPYAHDHTQRPHLPRGHPGSAELADVLTMNAAKPFGDEPIQPPSQHVLGTPSKHVFRGLVEQDDLLRVIDSDDGIHRRLHDAFEPQLVAKGVPRAPAFAGLRRQPSCGLSTGATSLSMTSIGVALVRRVATSAATVPITPMPNKRFSQKETGGNPDEDTTRSVTAKQATNPMT